MRLKSKLQKIEQLTMSKCSYVEYRTLMNENKMKSAPKAKTNIKQ